MLEILHPFPFKNEFSLPLVIGQEGLGGIKIQIETSCFLFTCLNVKNFIFFIRVSSDLVCVLQNLKYSSIFRNFSHTSEILLQLAYLVCKYSLVCVPDFFILISQIACQGRMGYCKIAFTTSFRSAYSHILDLNIQHTFKCPFVRM